MQQKYVIRKRDATILLFTDFLKVLHILLKKGKGGDTKRHLDLINNVFEVDCHVDHMKQVARLGHRDRKNTDRQNVTRPLLIEFK